MKTPMAERDAKTRARIYDAWKDPEVGIRDLVDRFSLPDSDVKRLKAELGPKATPAPLSNWSNVRKRLLSRRGWETL